SLAHGDELHLGRDDAVAGVTELGDRAARLRAQRAAGEAGEGAVRGAFRRAAAVLVDVAALEHPRAPERRQAPAHVRARAAVGVGTAGVVEPERRLAAGERDLARRDAHASARRRYVDLAGSGR